MEAKFRLFLQLMLIMFGSIALDGEKSVHKRIETLLRQGRNLAQFHGMIACETGKTFILYKYADYGCYCGFGGSGTPVDELDRCCQVHDECYERLQNDPDLCPFSFQVYSKWYTRDGSCTGCADPKNTCERALCECDGAAARCFAEAGWNKAYRNYDLDKC